MDCETFRDAVDLLVEEYDKTPRDTEPWEELVLTILSQNTSDDNRDVAYGRLIAEYVSPEEILDADVDHLKQLIAPAGLSNSKAEYLKNAARHVIENRDGDTTWIRDEPPGDVHDELTSIKGVGHKTADVVLMFSAGAELCPVDTHVNRVTHRLGVARDMSPSQTRERLLELKDECDVDLRRAHVRLIAHGREVCHARNPRCSDCVLEDVCEKNDVEA
ncbi:MAG: endonuclease III domain-containing protein [Halobacteriota archaeon]